MYVVYGYFGEVIAAFEHEAHATEHAAKFEQATVAEEADGPAAKVIDHGVEPWTTTGEFYDAKA